MGEASYKGLIQEMGPLLAAMGADGAAVHARHRARTGGLADGGQKARASLPAAALLLASLVEALMHAR